ncbi:HIRAN domain-containing protein [Acidimicrobiia bacterium]|nr:HIRAN domain-containing protein [Acidimicrobiia bacterium]
MKIPFLKKKWLPEDQFTSRKALLKGWINPLNLKSRTQDAILYTQDDLEHPQEVMGESFRQKIFIKQFGKHTKEGHWEECQAILYPELENDKDEFAVQVLIPAGPVGYLPRADAKKIQETLIRVMHQTQQMIAVEAIVKGGWKRGFLGRDKGYFGIELSIDLKELKQQMLGTLSDHERHFKPE